MPTDPNILSFLDKYKEYNVKDALKVTGGGQVFLEFPDKLEQDASGFAQPATDKYQDSLKEAKLGQEIRTMIPDGNSYYFMRALVKAHRMYRRSRITNACISLSDSKGTSEGDFINNIRQVGTIDVSPKVGVAAKPKTA
jgi:hypothetical protein